MNNIILDPNKLEQLIATLQKSNKNIGVENNIPNTDSIAIHWKPNDSGLQVYEDTLGKLEVMDSPTSRSLYLKKISVIENRKGHGTKLFRKVFQKSLDDNYNGKIEWIAAYNSHLFYAKMGGECTGDMPYLKYRYSDSFYRALHDPKPLILKLIKGKKLRKHEIDKVDCIKTVLSSERSEKYVSKEEISAQDLIEELDFLKILYNKRASLNTKLAEMIIQALDDYSTGITNSLSLDTPPSMHMHLSKPGIKRWKKCIENNKPFKTFKKFQHLRPYMNSQQKLRLDSVLNKLGF